MTPEEKARHDLYLVRVNNIETQHNTIYESVLLAGRQASRAIFLLASGGCVALLSYIAQAKTTPAPVYNALALFSIAAMLSTVQTGIVYLQLSYDYDASCKIYSEAYEVDPVKDAKRLKISNRLNLLAIFFWITSFLLINIAAGIIFLSDHPFG